MPAISFRLIACFLTVLALLAMTVPSSVTAQTRHAFAEEREHMVVEHIEAEGVTNERVLASMRAVPRHQFVRADLRKLAYSDQALDLGYKQTISPPFIVAYMTEVLDPQPQDRVLEIGTGSGYQAAVLSELVDEVYTIEIVEPLGKKAAELLKRLNYKNVTAKVGDGYLGWAEHAPFDKIIVTCSPEDIPKPLVDQLKEGGKMIIPLGERYQQIFHLLEKKEGKLTNKKLLPALFVPMTGKSEETREVQPDPLNPKLFNGGFEEILEVTAPATSGSSDTGTETRLLAAGWHYQRRSKIVEEDAPEGKRFIRFENTVPGRSAHILQGMAIDGSKILGLTLKLTLRLEEILPGSDPRDLPSGLLHFYDGKRIPLTAVQIGPWRDVPNWKVISQEIVVPDQAREAILQIGMMGSTGVMELDNLSVTGKKRGK